MIRWQPTGDGSWAWSNQPDLHGRLIVEQDTPCPICEREGRRSARGATPRQYILAEHELAEGERDDPFCHSHGYISDYHEDLTGTILRVQRNPDRPPDFYLVTGASEDGTLLSIRPVHYQDGQPYPDPRFQFGLEVGAIAFTVHDANPQLPGESTPNPQ
ncbi:hypothetical protein GCM10010411_76420 [Actinomadura fulvescens]|uniref:Uncharacterized protein n=1 Tax=Actinomadura fulvescens TaxID=46160 RepID=A0ABP6CTX0_9ACTN